VRQIRWTTEAADQLEAAVKRIQEDNPAAGRNAAQAIIGRIEQLASFPGLGRPGEVKGTRELSPLTSSCTAPPKKSSRSCTFGTARKTGDEKRKED